MKRTDIDRLLADGCISQAQHDSIIQHYNLHEEHSVVVRIFAIFGALLIASGIILIISANWDDIPRSVKIAGGLVLMLGTHALALRLRDRAGDPTPVSQSLHFAGALLFLANLALLGQIYHLSARSPLLFLYWWLGIVILPFLTGSRPLQILSVTALTLWVGAEVGAHDGLLFAGGFAPPLVIATLGFLIHGLGLLMNQGPTPGPALAPITRFMGQCLLLSGAFTLSIPFHPRAFEQSPAFPIALSLLAATAIALNVAGSRSRQDLTPQWRWVWPLSQAVTVALAGACYFLPPDSWTPSFTTYLLNLALAILGFIQVQVGVQTRSRSFINTGSACILVQIITLYFRLVGTMATTGLMFLISGVFLLGLGYAMEKHRRRWLHSTQTQEVL